MTEKNAAEQQALTNGPAAAAILASGVGSLALGLLTILAEVSAPAKSALIFYGPVGALSGVTTLAVAIWLVAWIAIHGLWKRKQVDFPRTFAATLAMVGLGLLGTFPPFFELFGG